MLEWKEKKKRILLNPNDRMLSFFPTPPKMGISAPANKIWTANHSGTEGSHFISVITFTRHHCSLLFHSPHTKHQQQKHQMAHQRIRKVTDHYSAAPHNQSQHHGNQQEQEQDSPAQNLAERVHSWSITELDYRPDRGDIRARSHPRISLHASTSRSEQPEYCPQALARYPSHFNDSAFNWHVNLLRAR